MELDDLYSSAHLFIAAIRVCEHRHAGRASVEDVCGLIGLSLEQGNFICKKLLEDGILVVPLEQGLHVVSVDLGEAVDRGVAAAKAISRE